MHKHLSLAMGLTAGLLGSCLQAAPLTKEEKEADFAQLTQMFAKNYGMLTWKKQHLNLDLQTLKEQYLPRVGATSNDGEFYRVCSNFISEWQDGHLSFQPAEETYAYLGFGVRRIEGKAIIVQVNRKALPESVFPYGPGDELVSIDGEAVERIADTLRHVISAGNEESTLGLVYRIMTVRTPEWTRMPTGTATLGIRKYGDEEVATTALPWIKVGKPLPGQNEYVKPRKPTADTHTPRFAHPREELFQKTNVSGIGVAMEVTAGAHLIQQDPFLAFSFDTPKGPVGYIRLPTFMPRDTEKAVKGFRQALKDMWMTKGLVVDLRDNGGGSLFYGYMIAGMFTDKPIMAPTFAHRTTRENILEYREWMGQIDNASERAAVQTVVDALEKAYAAGEEFTQYVPIDGMPMIQPDPEVQYTKPVVILINDQCYSMADIWPSIMRDNNRALLFGANTAGAGGAVVGMGPLTNSEAKVHMTVNILKRVNGQPVENLGVAPDVAFDVTVEDMANGLRNYTSAFVGLLLEQIK